MRLERLPQPLPLYHSHFIGSNHEFALGPYAERIQAGNVLMAEPSVPGNQTTAKRYVGLKNSMVVCWRPSLFLASYVYHAHSNPTATRSVQRFGAKLHYQYRQCPVSFTTVSSCYRQPVPTETNKPLLPFPERSSLLVSAPRDSAHSLRQPRNGARLRGTRRIDGSDRPAPASRTQAGFVRWPGRHRLLTATGASALCGFGRERMDTTKTGRRRRIARRLSTAAQAFGTDGYSDWRHSRNELMCAPLWYSRHGRQGEAGIRVWLGRHIRIDAPSSVDVCNASCAIAAANVGSANFEVCPSKAERPTATAESRSCSMQRQFQAGKQRATRILERLSSKTIEEGMEK